MKIMKFISAVMALLFTAWAAFQYNDPDPFIWILVYGLTALASILFLVNKLSLSFPLVFVLVGFVWALVLSTQIHYKDMAVAVQECQEEMASFVVVCSWIPRQLVCENWREMMGLVFASSWMGLLALSVFQAKRKKQTSDSG